MTKYIPERKHSFAEYGTFAIFASLGLFGVVVVASEIINNSYGMHTAFLGAGGGGILKSSIDML